MDKREKVNKTINKIMQTFAGRYEDKGEVITNWLNDDEESLTAVICLMVGLANNGWSATESVDDYQSDATFAESAKIYDRAMEYFKKGANNGRN